MDTTEYFDSYEDLKIHQLMLEDAPRNEAYRKAIEENKQQIVGKVVLDVGTGTGILAALFAKAGARKVYAVEASDVYKIAQDILKENQLSHIVEVIHGRIEEVNIPEQVDIIVSEWMGFYLFHEAMLNSVIVARDKYLKPNGLMFPESASLFSAPCQVPTLNSNWNTIEGISMKTFAEKLRKQAVSTPLVETVKPENILSDPETVTWIDLRDVTLDEVEQIKMQQFCVANKEGLYQGICLWFSCSFPLNASEPTVLSTEPEERATHWKQTTLVLPSTVQVEKGTPICYDLSLTRSAENNRQYKIEVEMLDPNETEHPEYCNCHLTKCILVKAMLDKYANEAMVE